MIIFNDHSSCFTISYPCFILWRFSTWMDGRSASCTAEGSRSATRFSSSSYWFKAARCAWPLFRGGDVSIFHGKKMQHSEYWNPPWNWSSLISPRKNHSISLVEKRHGCPAKKCPLWVRKSGSKSSEATRSRPSESKFRLLLPDDRCSAFRVIAGLNWPHRAACVVFSKLKRPRRS